MARTLTRQAPPPSKPGLEKLVKLAEGYGCTGTTVSTAPELEGAIQQGLTSPTPFVVRVDAEATTPPLLGKDGPKRQPSMR